MLPTLESDMIVIPHLFLLQQKNIQHRIHNMIPIDSAIKQIIEVKAITFVLRASFNRSSSGYCK